MSQVLGALLIFTLIPALGALPLTGWIVRILTNKNLKTLGTGNISVSAAFYHGGTLAGICAVTAEALKGICAVLLARYFFPGNAYGADIWPILSLIFLVMGRYWGSQGAGTTNIAWGFLAYDPLVATLTFGISLISFTLLRMKNQGKLFVLVLMPILTALVHPTQGGRILAVACLSGLVFWIYSKIPDDLELPPMKSAGESRKMFRFFQGDRALKSLATVLSPDQVGPKAATLSQLNAWGYPVAPGYILPAGDDPRALIKAVSPTPADPVIVRSSAIGEDTLTSSAAGQYVSVTQVESPAALDQAITVCLNAYSSNSAVRYRQSRNLPEGKMSVLVQPHIFGEFSGVAFSRDPLSHDGGAHGGCDRVIVETLPGDASNVVSGQITPERYQVTVNDTVQESWTLPTDLELPITGPLKGKAPTELIQQVAYLTRHIENRFHGIPQDVEWTFDGKQLWVLQSRPISTLMPIWTRKIAAEVIPGVIRPLTWSINRPLTCGVWGDLFISVLGDRAQGLDFTQTATLHYARAYFNATLLGDLFTRMGLPPESLEFLTRGASFSRPPLATTLRNAPGLWRLLRQEMNLPRSFVQDQEKIFGPAQTQFASVPLADLAEPAIIDRIESILSHLEKATYYNILAPLSLALRQAIFKVDLAALNNDRSPEVMALEDLKTMAAQMRSHLPDLGLSSPLNPNERTTPTTGASLFAALAEHPEGQHIFEQLDRFLDKYGYLSEVATDIAIPTWNESPQPVKELLTQYILNPTLTTRSKASSQPANTNNWKTRQIQTRLDLKGQVAETYNRLLAHLRSCFVELENRWINVSTLKQQGDIFFLTWEDICRQVSTPLPHESIHHKVELAKTHWQQIGDHRAPYLVYGSPAATDFPQSADFHPSAQTTAPTLSAAPTISGTLHGIGASTGQTEGTIRVLTSLADEDTADIDNQTILVVPYTDAGWSPLLARIGGLIAEVGGQLSHGAIVAREYGIPAIMDVTDATHRLTNGQRVRINGQQGTIEIL